jgi:hypothetical protein
MIYVRPSLSDAAVLMRYLASKPFAFWDGLSADDVTAVCMACHAAGVAVPARGTDAFGAAIAGDVETLQEMA